MNVFFHRQSLKIGISSQRNLNGEVILSTKLNSTAGVYLKLVGGFKKEMVWSGGVVYTNFNLKYPTKPKGYRWEPCTAF